MQPGVVHAPSFSPSRPQASENSEGLSTFDQQKAKERSKELTSNSSNDPNPPFPLIDDDQTVYPPLTLIDGGLTVHDAGELLPGSGELVQNGQESLSTGQPTTPIRPSGALQQTETNPPVSAQAPSRQSRPPNAGQSSRGVRYPLETKVEVIKKIQTGIDSYGVTLGEMKKHIGTQYGISACAIQDWWNVRDAILDEGKKKLDIVKYIQERWTYETDWQNIVDSAAHHFNVEADMVSSWWDDRQDPAGFGVKEKVISFLQEKGNTDAVLVEAVRRFDISLPTVLDWSHRGGSNVDSEEKKKAVIELIRERHDAIGARRRAAELFGVNRSTVYR